MNVYEASLKRLDLIFSEFDNVYVSFSGGKDSGVLLNLCIDYIRKNKLNRKLGVFHMDYEAQYEMTTQYVDEVLHSNKDILEVYHICMPFKVTCATSMQQGYWRPWEDSLKEVWVRDRPIDSINIDNHRFDFWNDALWDYDFQGKFSHWIHQEKKAKKTCCLVGIRTQESLNRWRAIHSERNYKNYRDLGWTKEMYPEVYNAYPIYDWNTQDVWVGNAKNGWSYNPLYDLYYQAGLNIDQMRVASPFIDTAIESLKLYKAIDPNMWAKMVGRVNGVNFSSIYGGTTAMGWKNIKLPKGHTWKSYMFFLLDTLPNDVKENYLNKLNTSIKFWKEKGGVLSKETIEELKGLGISLEVGKTTNYNTDKLPVRMDYLDEIDSKDFKLIPSYKRMCICIMKNDHLCKYMGFTLTKNENERRKNIMEKYNNIL